MVLTAVADFLLILRCNYSAEAQSISTPPQVPYILSLLTFLTILTIFPLQPSQHHHQLPACQTLSGFLQAYLSPWLPIPIAVAEASCAILGAPHCIFVVSPPKRLRQHLQQTLAREAQRWWLLGGGDGPEPIWRYELPMGGVETGDGGETRLRSQVGRVRWGGNRMESGSHAQPVVQCIVYIVV